MAPQVDWHTFLGLRASEPLSLFDKGMGNSIGERLRPTDKLWSLKRHEG